MARTRYKQVVKFEKSVVDAMQIRLFLLFWFYCNYYAYSINAPVMFFYINCCGRETIQFINSLIQMKIISN